MEIPEQLRQRSNWVLWRDEGGRKIPYQTNGTHAKSNDPTTWTTLDDARKNQNGYTGLGFVFDRSGVFGVDLDGCVIDRIIQPWAQSIIEQFDSPAELSPSKTGVHIYALGRLSGSGKKIDLDKPKIGSKQPGIEVYDKGRYFTFTGNWVSRPKMVDRQDALDALLAEYWPKPTNPIRTVTPTPKADNVADRAARYLATMPGAVSGCSGHNVTFRAACVLVLGFNLTPGAAYPILVEWNARCEPPWTEKELRHKLDSANKQEGQRGELLNQDTYSDVDLSRLMPTLSVDKPEEIEPKQDIVFPAECIDNMPPLMRLAYDYTIAKAIKPQPELTLAALIAMFGAIFGRKVRDDYGTRTNVMVLGLSPSGSGKEHPRQIVKEILFEAGLDLLSGPERIGSHAGIISSMAHHPTRLFQLDEIGRLLHTMRDPRSSHLYNIGTVLMQLYSSSGTIWTGDAYADLAKVKRINQPCVCVYGTSVPESFYGGLTTDNLSDGLLGRMLVVEASGHPARRKPQQADMPQELIESIKRWATYGVGNMSEENPSPIIVAKTDDANKRHELYANEVNTRHKKDDAEEASIWARAPEKAAKLALIYACCCEHQGPPLITLDAINWGRVLTNYATRLVIVRASGKAHGEWAYKKQKAWAKLKSGMTRRDWQRRTQWLRKREREEILAEWVDLGAVEVVTKSTGANPTVVLVRRQNRL